jgi:hypothetical protein
MKYLGRYKNFRREKDLLKIATYMYIAWLKEGYHKLEVHDEDIKKDSPSPYDNPIYDDVSEWGK